MENNQPNNNDEVSQMKYIVRKFTPTESERIMGLPDEYTIPAFKEITDELVEYFIGVFAEWDRVTEAKGKPKTAKQVRTWLEKISDPATCPDGPRFKVDGNGWAVNQPRWILMRTLNVLRPNWRYDN